MPCLKHDDCPDCRTLAEQGLRDTIQATAEYVLRLHHCSHGFDQLRAQVALILNLPEPLVYQSLLQMLELRPDMRLTRGTVYLDNQPRAKPAPLPLLPHVRIMGHKLKHQPVPHTRNTYKVECTRCGRRCLVTLPGQDWQDNFYIAGRCWPWSWLVKPRHRDLQAQDYWLPPQLAK